MSSWNDILVCIAFNRFGLLGIALHGLLGIALQESIGTAKGLFAPDAVMRGMLASSCKHHDGNPTKPV